MTVHAQCRLDLQICHRRDGSESKGKVSEESFLRMMYPRDRQGPGPRSSPALPNERGSQIAKNTLAVRLCRRLVATASSRLQLRRRRRSCLCCLLCCPPVIGFLALSTTSLTSSDDLLTDLAYSVVPFRWIAQDIEHSDWPVAQIFPGTHRGAARSVSFQVSRGK